MQKNMILRSLMILIAMGILIGQELPDVDAFFGFRPGDDRQLMDYDDLIDYLQLVAVASPQVRMEQVGETMMGKPMYLLFLSSAANIEQLRTLQHINRELALNPDLSGKRQDIFFSKGKVFVFLTLSMHSSEVGPSQALPLIVDELLRDHYGKFAPMLEDVVLMITPSQNPDGMDMVVDYYRDTKGTEDEGTYMPGVYHKYVGHDNNRDLVNLTQSESRIVNRIYSTEWCPQVIVNKHQMGSTGPRYWVPPAHDPIAVNIPEEVWNWTGIFGANMITDMTAAGLQGIAQLYIFDEYWPGGNATALWKNVISLLTECASVRTASPIYIEPNELRVSGKGLSEYAKSINFPDPWPGGWWRLADIVEYERESTYAILQTAARYREEILRYRFAMARKSVDQGLTEAPYYFILRGKQQAPDDLVKLVNLLNEHGVRVQSLSRDLVLDSRQYLQNDLVVALAQPYRPFIKEVLEVNDFPERHYTPGGDLIRPYDVTSWSLPYHRGVTVEQIDTRYLELEEALVELELPFSLNRQVPAAFRLAVLPANRNESYRAAFEAASQHIAVDRLMEDAAIQDIQVPAGSFLIKNEGTPSEELDRILSSLDVEPVYLSQELDAEAVRLVVPRIALVESYFHDMDAGWTRYVLDEHAIPFDVLRPADLQDTRLIGIYDVLILANENKSILYKGKYKSASSGYNIPNYAPEYAQGMEKSGLQRIAGFLDHGGTVVSWGRSSELFLQNLTIDLGEGLQEEFRLPVRDISNSLEKKGFSAPGSLLRVTLQQDHPLTWGLPDEIGVFSRGAPVYATSLPSFDMDRRVIGHYSRQDTRISGFAENVDLAAGKPVVVWLSKGDGQLVLMGFSPQFRGSTQGSFKLIFNSILLDLAKAE